MSFLSSVLSAICHLTNSPSKSIFNIFWVTAKMNWVGGSRKRLMMKDDAKRQREFFERTKMQQRLKKMGLPPVPSSPKGSACVSMDLLTLFVVNQIASKKENKEPPKVALFSGGKGSKKKQKQPLVLPMSPGSPSKLSLMDAQSCSFPGPPQKYVIPQRFKYQQLSPVLESAFSDISASDYQRSSPFSSKSSASSGRVSLQLNLLQRSQQSPLCQPSPWGTSVLERTEFPPLSEPRGTCAEASWKTSFTLVPQHSPSADLLPCSVAQERPGEADFALHQTLFQEPTLEFITGQEADNENLFVEDVSSCFSGGDYGAPGAASDFSTVINTHTPQMYFGASDRTVPVTMSREELTDSTNQNCVVCSGQTRTCCHLSPVCSHRGGYSSSSDEEVHCQPAHQRCCNQNLHSPGNQRSPSLNSITPQKFTQSYPENVPLWTHSVLSRTCSECRRTTNPLQDSGTQTDATVEKSDAETQYDLQTNLSVMGPQPPDVLIPVAATGGQAGSTQNDGSEATGIQSGIFPQNTSSRSILQGYVSYLEDRARDQQPGLARPLNDDHVKVDRTNASRSHRLTEDSETLQDIANILLMLKQKMKEE
ncbi:uncharacterized protein LOC128756766 isoform X2 [Synchiropus splendidus]|uniref:uncharacterized protein LOC128756766 isoform X2 n=1 Tax=Synchiropus splendidus TaxID=270530 RepID=UPI00237E004B|nr:uncharacterized protein LOC128756766 isoform X2 [Synchiropus splendidus]